MSNVHIVGDTPEKKEDQINPFNLNLSSELRLWLNQE